MNILKKDIQKTLIYWTFRIAEHQDILEEEMN